MMSKRSRLVLASMAGLLVLSASGPSAGAPGVRSVARIDLTASAQPRFPLVPVTDSRFDLDSVVGVPVHAATTATASATCASCSGTAISVQVLYLDHPPTGELDNAAIAWAQSCLACSAVAVSIQVVQVRDAGSLMPTNRALAVTTGCSLCRASSAAYQLVVAGGGRYHLTAGTLRALDTWASERAVELSELSSARNAKRWVRAGQARSLGRIARRVNAELGTATIAARARVVWGPAR
jgi:hypothetical protein